MRQVLVGLLETPALRAKEPSVIGATQAAFVRDAEFERKAAMRTPVIDETILAALGAEERQVLTETPYAPHRLFGQLDLGADGMPIAPQEIAHRRATTDPCQPLILFLGCHDVSPLIGPFLRRFPNPLYSAATADLCFPP